MGYETPQSKRTLKKRAYRTYRQSIAPVFERRRRERILGLAASVCKTSPEKPKLLEVGCGLGKDFLRHFDADPEYQLFGLDMRDLPGRLGSFEFIEADASDIPFEDNHFEVAVSIGVLEHVSPVVKLDQVTAEIARVSEYFIVVVPGMGTLLEPHVMQFRWQTRSDSRRAADDHLFYYSDEAWLQMSGFRDARAERFSYVPGLIQNLLITNIPPL